MSRASFPILVIVFLAHLVAWAVPNHVELGPRSPEPVRGLSFNPYRADEDPVAGRFPSPSEIDQDLALLEGKTQSVRTYGSTNGLEEVPQLAQRHQLRVTVGAWLDTRLAANEIELRNAIANARRFDNVEGVLVGNETILRGDLTVQQLLDYIARTKHQVSVLVSTAEPWHVWIQHPELVDAVDQITVHLIPYWEGADSAGAVPIAEAVNYVRDRYQLLQRTYPGKRIVIGEVGWPSAGEARGVAEPSPVYQARFVREFLQLAREQHLDYFLLEAFDQPWKGAEGSVGPHWGLFDADRQPTLAWEDREAPGHLPWQLQWALASALGLGLVSGWAEWCLGEDAELGLRLLQRGYRSVYVKESFGHGLVPDSYAGYKKQRFRWAYNAVQILRHHWRVLLPGSGLTVGQRFHFAAGWLPWLGDALHLVFTPLMLGWTAAMLAWPSECECPLTVFLAPTLAVFGFNMVRSLWLYHVRVGCTFWQSVGAMIAGMGLAHTVGRAYLTGLLNARQPFLRTPKCENQPALVRSLAAVHEELPLLLALWAAVVAVIVTDGLREPATLAWLLALVLQSVPYAAAVLTALVSSLPGSTASPALAASPTLGERLAS